MISIYISWVIWLNWTTHLFVNTQQGFFNKDFSTWLLIGRRLSCQPIRCQVWKSLLTNMEFNMENFLVTKNPGRLVINMWIKQGLAPESCLDCFHWNFKWWLVHKSLWKSSDAQDRNDFWPVLIANFFSFVRKVYHVNHRDLVSIVKVEI